MESSQVQRAITIAQTIVGELGLSVNEAVVIHNSDRIAVRLLPCDVLARIAPQTVAESLQFEAEIAWQLAQTNSPVGLLEPHAQSRVYVRDGFALSFWIYYEPAGEIAPADYAEALRRFHVGLAQIDYPVPHISERIATWSERLHDPQQTPDIPDAERELLSTTLKRVQAAMQQHRSADQLLHGEPHPGNLLSTKHGPLFIDLHTCQRGPIEYDIAFIPEAAAAHYSGANQALVHEFRILMWAGFTIMRWYPWDQFPERDHWRNEGMKLLRAALDRA
jgi:hypothetical protein